MPCLFEPEKNIGLSFQIDADALSGICFPGFNNIWVRLGYIIAPIVVAMVIGSVFSIRGV